MLSLSSKIEAEHAKLIESKETVDEIRTLLNAQKKTRLSSNFSRALSCESSLEYTANWH